MLIVAMLIFYLVQPSLGGTPGYTNRFYNKAETVFIAESDEICIIKIHDILRWRNLRALYLNDQQLERIPEIIGTLDNLIELHLYGNNIKSLPNGIARLRNLRILDLGNNQLTEVPESLQYLKNLTHLNLSRNKIYSIPIWFGALANLKYLDISVNLLTGLPDTFSKLIGLATLYISNNPLGRFPAPMQSLVDLLFLYMDNTQLTQMPDEIRAFKNLHTLSLSGNNLCVLPTWIPELVRLTHLEYSSNNLRALPENLDFLNNLMSLFLGSNGFYSIPASIGRLVELRILYLEDNNLTALPREIGSLTKLITLNVMKNNLRRLPAEISGLTKLERLYICFNIIVELHSGIGDLPQLRCLIAYGNSIHEVPASIGRLARIEHLDLSENPFLKLPREIKNLRESIVNLIVDGDILDSSTHIYVGKDKIAKWFGHKVTFVAPEELVSGERHKTNQLYKSMQRENLAWAFDRIIALRPPPIRTSQLTEHDVLRIWHRKLFSRALSAIVQDLASNWKHSVDTITIERDIREIINAMPTSENVTPAELDSALHGIKEAISEMEDKNRQYSIIATLETTVTDINRLLKYIHDVYNPKDSNIFFNTAAEKMAYVTDRLSAVFELLPSVSDDDDLTSYLSMLYEGLEYCLDGQVEAINSVYYLITGGKNPEDDLDAFVTEHIIKTKGFIFKELMTRENGPQSVHVHNYWMHCLGDELGLDQIVDFGFGTQDQDPYEGSPLAIIREFYKHFAPGKVISDLPSEINNNAQMLCVALRKICMQIKNKNRSEKWGAMYTSPNNDILEAEQITEAYTKHVLLNMGVITEQCHRLNNPIQKSCMRCF